MVTHLSLINKPFENLNLVARGVTMTKDYAEIHEDMVRQEFPAKINTLTVTSLAMGGISFVIALLVNKKAGIVLACSTAIPLVGLFYQRQRRNVFLSKLDGAWNGIRSTFLQMAKYLDDERQFKENVLVNEFNGKIATTNRDYAQTALGEVEKNFNIGKITFSDAEERERYQTHRKIRDLMNLILAMEKPPLFYEMRWEEFHISCYKFLHGRHNQRLVSSSQPYVSLEFKEGSWRATRTV